MKGAAEALYLLTKNPSGKFEFIFTPLGNQAIPLVDVLKNIHRLDLTDANQFALNRLLTMDNLDKGLYDYESVSRASFTTSYHSVEPTENDAVGTYFQPSGRSLEFSQQPGKFLP